MTTTKLIELCTKATLAARALRALLFQITEVLADPDAHAHSADLYGAIAERRETMRPASMLLGQRQQALFDASPLGRALNRAWNEGAERARKSLQAGAEVGS